MKPLLSAVLCIAALSACKEEDLSAAPPAVEMTREALGHYCQMNLVEHPGPKAQVHLKGTDAPIYFAQVRDAIAYKRMPEQSHAIAAIYVNDMGVAPSWESPGTDNWIAAKGAHYVIGSIAVGGMGTSELVPFSDPAAADQFTKEYGGRVVGFGAVIDDDVLTPDQGESSGDQDFIDRLVRLTEEGRG